jgi:S-formylglutathione hydrolase FrmB
LSEILDWELVHGTMPAVITAVGAIAGLMLLVRRGRRWWLQSVPLVAGSTVLLCALLVWIVDGLWQPFPDSLPLRVVYWIGAALFAIGLASVGMPTSRWWRRGVAVVAALLVLTTATIKINAFYGYYPSLRAAFGLPPANEVTFASMNTPAPKAFQPPVGQALIDSWQPPPGLPNHGAVSQVTIPSPESGFKTTRSAYVYAPPAYQASTRPLLPVLVLLHGQPGAPSDWVNGGQVSAMMDRYAAAHHGLAPIIVMPDTTGGPIDNPLCVDGKRGKNETYLAKDVPAWIRHNLQVDPDPKHLAIGGSSYGGTCALQLALRHPDIYPTFVDSSGQDQPTLGSRSRTINEIFGGDEAAFRRVNPMDLLAGNKYPGSAGVISVGAADREYMPQQRRVLEACQRNGLNVTWREVTGGHNWQGWAAGLEASLDWLAGRLGLVRP